jgi:hypothetical protein
MILSVLSAYVWKKLRPPLQKNLSRPFAAIYL